MDINDKKQLIKGIVMIISGVIIFVAALIIFIPKDYGVTMKTSAEVISSEYHSRTNGHDYYNILVRYEVDGQTYMTTLTGCTQGENEKKTIMITYNPDNPEEAFSEISEKHDYIYVLLGGVVAVVAIGRGIFIIYPFINEWQCRKRLEKEQREKAPDEY